MTPAQRVEVLRACCCVAGIDGHTDEVERAFLEKLADELGVGETSLGAMIERAESDKDFYQQQFRILKDSPQECIGTILEAAVVNGSITPDELDVVKRLAVRLEVDQETFTNLAKSAVADVEVRGDEA